MDTKTLFYIGIILGFIGGVALTLVFISVKSLFSAGEVRKLRQEKKSLEKRIQEKNRHIDEMMGHAEQLARDFTKRPPSRDE